MTATFTTGLMGSGKSKALIEKFQEETEFSFIFAASLDMETGTFGQIKSRNGQTLTAINLNVADHLEAIKLIKKLIVLNVAKTIYLDEVQFMKRLTVSEILNLCIEFNVDVHFFGLDTTFTGDYFEASNFLMSKILPENMFKIEMTCQSDNCDNTAEYNARIIDGKVSRQGQTFVENKSTYLSLCKDHYF